MTNNDDPIRLQISPEPSDEELLAILEALQVLDDDQSDTEDRVDPTWSHWQAAGRRQEQRLRHWTVQELSWSRRR